MHEFGSDRWEFDSLIKIVEGLSYWRSTMTTPISLTPIKLSNFAVSHQGNETYGKIIRTYETLITKIVLASKILISLGQYLEKNSS